MADCKGFIEDRSMLASGLDRLSKDIHRTHDIILLASNYLTDDSHNRALAGQNAASNVNFLSRYFTGRMAQKVAQPGPLNTKCAIVNFPN